LSRVLGVGIDLVEVARIAGLLARHPDRFVDRICGPAEVDRSRTALDQHVAGLFAAKEAVMKALGTGWAEGVGFRDVEVVRGPAGAPTVRLHGAAAAHAERLGAQRVHLSITHERGHAAAVAILEGEGPADPPVGC
jgi:holo-[acyl-carrier protein] synthase